MCPMCLAASGLYIAGGVSAGGITTFLATKLLRKRHLSPPRRRGPNSVLSPPRRRGPNFIQGDDHATTDNRIAK